MPLVPRFQFCIVDVRDVALAHLRAMKAAEAAGMLHHEMFHLYPLQTKCLQTKCLQTINSFRLNLP